MKIIIAGSREGMPEDEFKRELEGYLADENIEVSEVVCGKAKGIDTLGEMWAKQRSIPVAEFPANWERHGRAAGPIRNAEMAEYGDLLIAFQANKSRGTANMVRQMRMKGKPVKVFEI